MRSRLRWYGGSFSSMAPAFPPKHIALSLNGAGIPGPRGGRWSPSAINGNRQNGTGALNNEVYVGRMTWDRRTWFMDPATGKRLARANEAAALVAQPAPEFRIVSDELWQAVKVRQGRLDHGLARGNDAAVVSRSAEPTQFWTKQWPGYLFSGLMCCGQCSGGYSKVSAHRFGRLGRSRSSPASNCAAPWPPSCTLASPAVPGARTTRRPLSAVENGRSGRSGEVMGTLHAGRRFGSCRTIVQWLA